MKFAPIINPAARRDSPEPVRVDLRKVFLVGIGLWAVATIVFAIMASAGLHVTFYLRICLAGIVIGLILLIWERLDRSNYRKLGV